MPRLGGADSFAVYCHVLVDVQHVPHQCERVLCDHEIHVTGQTFVASHFANRIAERKRNSRAKLCQESRVALWFLRWHPIQKSVVEALQQALTLLYGAQSQHACCCFHATHCDASTYSLAEAVAPFSVDVLTQS